MHPSATLGLTDSLVYHNTIQRNLHIKRRLAPALADPDSRVNLYLNHGASGI